MKNYIKIIPLFFAQLYLFNYIIFVIFYLILLFAIANFCSTIFLV